MMRGETCDTFFDGLTASRACRGTLHEERTRRNFVTNRHQSCVLGHTRLPQSIGIVEILGDHAL